jgi:hypothetical protein
MDNQHKLIKGYRDLSQEEIDLMNEIKAKGEEVGNLVDKVYQSIHEWYMKDIEKDFQGTVAFNDKADPSDWAYQAKQDLQVGFMKLVRAVAKPTTF